MKITSLLAILLTLFQACAYKGNPVIKLPAGQDYLQQDSGRIHRSCLERFGGKFVTAIDAAALEGISVLKET